jgi:L-2,4-diaminobutyric acid acetyltransferase
MPKQSVADFSIRNVTVEDIKQVYKLLVDNRPYVGLNSRYTYFLLARDFSGTCTVALDGQRVIAFSSGYVPPKRPDTFFNWEIVVNTAYRGLGLQKTLLLNQIRLANAKFFEATINPSNVVSRRNFVEIAKLLHADYQESVLFSEEDFDNDGHEAEVLFRIGPIAVDMLKNVVEI